MSWKIPGEFTYCLAGRPHLSLSLSGLPLETTFCSFVNPTNCICIEGGDKMIYCLYFSMANVPWGKNDWPDTSWQSVYKKYPETGLAVVLEEWILLYRILFDLTWSFSSSIPTNTLLDYISQFPIDFYGHSNFFNTHLNFLISFTNKSDMVLCSRPPIAHTCNNIYKYQSHYSVVAVERSKTDRHRFNTLNQKYYSQNFTTINQFYSLRVTRKYAL